MNQQRGAKKALRNTPHSLCLALGLSPDPAVDVESCVAPAEDFLHQGKGDELFPEKQREELMGEDFLDNLVMETTDTVEGVNHGL